MPLPLKVIFVVPYLSKQMLHDTWVSETFFKTAEALFLQPLRLELLKVSTFAHCGIASYIQSKSLQPSLPLWHVGVLLFGAVNLRA